MSEAMRYRIEVPEAKIVAIKQRVATYDWDALANLVEHNNPWSAGASLAFMRELCDYWVNRFDWRAQEAAMNRIPADYGTRRRAGHSCAP